MRRAQGKKGGVRCYENAVAQLMNSKEGAKNKKASTFHLAAVLSVHIQSPSAHVSKKLRTADLREEKETPAETVNNTTRRCASPQTPAQHLVTTTMTSVILRVLISYLLCFRESGVAVPQDVTSATAFMLVEHSRNETRRV